MTVAELIRKLSDFPMHAEVLVLDEGDPSVGIWERAWSLSGEIGADSHPFVPEEIPRSDGSGSVTCCAMCGIIESAHVATPVLVGMRIEQ